MDDEGIDRENSMEQLEERLLIEEDLRKRINNGLKVSEEDLDTVVSSTLEINKNICKIFSEFEKNNIVRFGKIHPIDGSGSEHEAYYYSWVRIPHPYLNRITILLGRVCSYPGCISLYYWLCWDLPSHFPWPEIDVIINTYEIVVYDQPKSNSLFSNIQPPYHKDKFVWRGVYRRPRGGPYKISRSYDKDIVTWSGIGDNSDYFYTYEFKDIDNISRNNINNILYLNLLHLENFDLFLLVYGAITKGKTVFKKEEEQGSYYLPRNEENDLHIQIKNMLDLQMLIYRRMKLAKVIKLCRLPMTREIQKKLK